MLEHLATSPANLILAIDKTIKNIQMALLLRDPASCRQSNRGNFWLLGMGLSWGKSAQLLNKCAKIVKSGEMGQLLQKAANIVSKAPELEAVTAEGLKVAVPKAAELCALSEAANTAKQAGNSISKTTLTSKAITTSIKQTPSYLQAQKTIAECAQEFKKLGLKPISNSNLKHIINSHSIDGTKAASGLKSVFYKGENIIDLALQGWEKGTFIDKNTKIFDCGRFIGTDLAGNPTTKIKIALTETIDSFRTIFPC